MIARAGRVAAVILAGGSGSRFGADGNKAYIPLAGRTLLSWSVNTLARLPEVGRLIVVVRADDYAVARDVIDREVASGPVELIVGGSSRHDSEYAAVTHLRPAIEEGATDLVLIHDAARPLVTLTLARSVITVASERGGAVPGLLDDELAHVHGDGSLGPGEPAGTLVRSQTPQAFHAPTLLDVYRQAAAEGFEGTDTSESFERYSDLQIRIVEGDPRNLKVTYPHDLFRAEQLLAAANYEMI